jgi:hypothetical protein
MPKMMSRLDISVGWPNDRMKRSVGRLGKPPKRAHMRIRPNLAKGHNLVNQWVGSPMGKET